ncbi:unnamed protein product [Heterobilharzia americana]|nr:unnamed protein product [Heterobilharzia americana]CAH8443169.1 unnamed protein product [Heterobilharzia americana]
MSESFSSKFAQLNVRSEKSSHSDSSTNHQHTNGEEEKGSKGNPWKPIVPSSENNSLEADAWPEPSAPAEQRRITRIAEEKPKRKLKWQNYEVDDAACGFSRGRGRHSVGPFTGANYAASGNVRSFRRGFGGYRSRILTDANRGRNSNGFYRHPGRMANIRSCEPKEHTNEPARSSPGQPTSEACNVMIDGLQSSTDVSPSAEKVSDGGQNVLESLEASGQQSETELQTPKANTVSVVTGPTPRKGYRDRTNVSSQSGSQMNNIPSNYDAGPVGRARRSYQRQHQPMFPAETENHNLNSHPSLVANTSIQPLIPFQTIPQIAYIIPGTPATMLGTALQLPQTPASHTIIPHSVSIANNHILPTQPSVQHPIAALPHIPVENITLPILSDVPTLQAVHSGFNPQSSVTSTTTEQPADTIEVVDVTQVISFINDAGWKKVVFPISLREHRAVAAALKDALGSTNQDLADFTESAANKNDLSASSTQSRNDDVPARPVKADDVIIVEDRVFFVPKNVNRTKFLKFLSKLDYIKHHVEYYFSESNLQRDSHLFSILTANQDVCPLSELLQFNRLRWVSTTESELLDAVSSSSVLLVVFSPDGSPTGITRVCTMTKQVNESCAPVDISYARPINHSVVLTSSAVDQDVSFMQVPVCNQSQTHPGVDPSSQSLPVMNPASSVHSFGSVQVSANSNNTPFPVTTQILGVAAHSLNTLPHNSHPNYIQSSAHILSPNNLGILTSAAPANIYSNSSPSQPHAATTTPFYQGDIGPQSSTRSPQQTPFNCPQLYSQQQAAALVAAAANQCSLLASGPNAPTLPPTDPNTASFISALYRLATPGNTAPFVGTYVPSVGNPSNIAGGAPNSAVFLQFIPGAHLGQTNAYFTPTAISCPPGNNSLLNRSIPTHPSGMWIPLNAGSVANGGIVSAHPYQPYVALTQAHSSLSVPNNASGNGALYSVTSSHSFPTAFGTVPTLTIGPDISGFAVQKMFNHTHSLSNPQTYTNHQSPITSGANVTTINTPSSHASQVNVIHGPASGQQQSGGNLVLGKRMPTNPQP